MPNIDLLKIEKSLEKSGFVLEHKVTEQLKENKWSVINNKYYIDDVHDVAREIDLIAYKINIIDLAYPKPSKKLYIYTTLIISCKKNEEKLWTLLFRELDANNPNINWFPIKNWTNDKIYNFIFEKDVWQSSYLEESKISGIYSKIFDPTGHLFAFQEIHKSRYTVQNDKDIFGAVTSLMKAESYEIDSLKRRKNDIAIYNFNLVSIIETELVKIHYQENNVNSEEVEEARAIFNYIINKQETSSRIHFCTFKNLQNCLDNYEKLHNLNIKFLTNLYKDFYKDLFNDSNKINLLKESFMASFIRQIKWILNDKFGESSDFSDIEIYFSKLSNTLKLEIQASSTEIEFINNNKFITEYVKKKLENIFFYSGDFLFVEEDIPF